MDRASLLLAASVVLLCVLEADAYPRHLLLSTPNATALAPKVNPGCWPAWGSVRRTVLFVADPGTFSNTPENAIYVKNLKVSKKLPHGDTGCPDVLIGQIMRQDVAVVTTGIGSEAAAMCVFEVLVRCGDRIRDATYSGTSGWSPQLGGILNNGSCGAANGNGKITRIGDVCVSPLAVNWACRKASWQMTSQGYPNECTFPEQLFSAQSDFLFGKCSFYSAPIVAALPFADEVIAAAAKGLQSVPPRPDAIVKNEDKFWANMREGTRATYPALSATAAPHLWTYKECMEISSQYFWSGAPWDMVARKYVADTLNAANATRLKRAGGKPYGQADVIAVSAMEAIGIAGAVERYAALTGGRPVPFTVVRGMSNHAVQPVAKNGTGLWAPGEEVPEDFVNGYKYAIQTGSTAVLSLLKERCLKTGGKEACVFKVV